MRFVERLFIKNLRRTGKIVLIFFMGLSVLIFLINGFIALGFSYPLDYGEGPLLNQALRLIQGEPLYPKDIASPPYLISNYPPVFVIISAFFVWVFGPNLVIGRIIAFLSTLGSAILMYLILKVFFPKQQKFILATGAAIFLAIPYVLEWSALFRIDMLGLFFSMLGIFLVIKDPENNLMIYTGALCFVLAAFTRQSLGLAGPLSAIIYTFTKDKKQALKLFLTYTIVGATVFGLLYWITDGSFFFHIITANVNPFNWQTVQHFAQDIARKMPWLLALLVLYVALGWRYTRTYAFLCPYLLAGMAAALTIGKVGSNVNYLVEFSAGLALLAGVVFSRMSETFPIDPALEPDMNFSKDEIPVPDAIDQNIKKRLWANLVIFLVLTCLFVVQIGGLSRSSLSGPITWRRNRIKKDNDYVYLEENIKLEAEKGPILVDEFMGILPENHIPLFIQPFEMTQLANAGLWDQTPLLHKIENQEFPLILIHHFQNSPVFMERWTDEMREEIYENYVAVNMKADTLFFEPKNFSSNTYPEDLLCPQVPWRLPTTSDLGMLWESGQVLMMGDFRKREVPVYAVADGLLFQFPGWETALAIQHQDPLQSGKHIWSFYGDMAPAYDPENAYIDVIYQGADGIPVKAGDLIGYQGRWLGPDQQTWVHLRFTLLPAEDDGSFPEAFLNINDFNADLPGVREQTRIGLEGPVSLSTYTGLPESRLYGAFDFLPFMCTLPGE